MILLHLLACTGDPADSGAGCVPTTEICDGFDNDCDGVVDDSDPDLTGAPTWYADGDRDGFGSTELHVAACARPSSYVATPNDCDDDDPGDHPGAPEVCENGDDEDCDGFDALCDD